MLDLFMASQRDLVFQFNSVSGSALMSYFKKDVKILESYKMIQCLEKLVYFRVRGSIYITYGKDKRILKNGIHTFK